MINVYEAAGLLTLVLPETSNTGTSAADSGSVTVNDHAANSVSEYTNIYKYHVFKLQDGDGRYFGAKYKIAVTLRRKMSKTDNIYNTAAVMSNLESVAFESQSFYTVVD